MREGFCNIELCGQWVLNPFNPVCFGPALACHCSSDFESMQKFYHHIILYHRYHWLLCIHVLAKVNPTQQLWIWWILTTPPRLYAKIGILSNNSLSNRTAAWCCLFIRILVNRQLQTWLSTVLSIIQQNFSLIDDYICTSRWLKY